MTCEAIPLYAMYSNNIGWHLVCVMSIGVRVYDNPVRFSDKAEGRAT